MELLGQDGYLAERQVLRLKGGQASGSFCLEDSLYAGFYELRAYTRWQLNFGRKEHPHDPYINRWFLKKEYAQEFFVDYDKLYSRVFPVYDKPQQPGEYYRDMTVRPLRRDYRDEKIPEKPAVSLFPEGGNLIGGIRQRVAFEARDGEGRHAEGRLFVLGENGDTLCSARTENRGRGCLDLCTEYGKKVSGIFEDEEGRQTKVSLPNILPSGAALRVEQDSESIKADIGIQGTEKDSVLLLVTTCGRPRMHIPYMGEPLTVGKDSLPAGVAQLTLLRNGNILADRLVFVHKPELQEAPLKILGMKEDYEPLEQVSLKVQGKAGATFSLSVRDKATGDPIFDNGSIMTEMLLSSHIKGFVENPGYYFEKDDAERRRHLDLLLMVQGWRRFGIRQPEIVEPYEKSQMIVGEVNKYTPLDQEDGFILVAARQQEDTYMRHGYGGPIPVRGTGAGNVQGFLFVPTDESPLPLWYTEDSTSVIDKPLQTYDYETLSSPMRKTHLHAEYVQPGATPVYGDLTVGEDGKFTIQAPHFGGYCLMHLAAANPDEIKKNDKDGKKKKAKAVAHQWLMPSADEYAAYSIRIRTCHPRFVKPYEYYQLQIREAEDSGNTGSKKVGDITSLQEVRVKGRRRILRKLDLDKPALVMDVYEAFNQTVDAGLTCAFYAGSMSFSNNLARLLVGDMGIRRTYPMERRWDGRNISVGSIGVKEEQLKYNHLENLDNVYLYTDYSPRMEGDTKFNGSDQPSVTIDLHRFLDDSKRTTYRDRFIVLDGYSTSAEFYSPDYSKQELPPKGAGGSDYRRTLYWNPDVQLDENGEAVVTFYNNSRQTSLSVEAEGQAPDGTLLWGQKGME